MKNAASAGFQEYQYPKWSTILGWFIFAACIISIPLFYVINYIKEYLAIGFKEIVRLVFFYFVFFFIFFN